MAASKIADVAKDEINRLRRCLKQAEQENRELKLIIKDLKRIVNILQKDAEAQNKETRRLLGKLAKKERLLEECEEKIAAQQKELAVLEDENARIMSIMNLTSRTSSKPPSTDQRGNPKSEKEKQEPTSSGKATLDESNEKTGSASPGSEVKNESTEKSRGRKGANQYNGRRSSNKNKGGQPKRKGTTLQTEDVLRMLAEGKCEHIIKEEGTPKGHFTSRYVLDFKMVPVITEYHFYEDAEIPERLVRSQVVYGENIRAAACYLYTLGGMSNELITQFLRVASDDAIRVSHGAVYGFLKQMARDAQPTLTMLEEELLREKAINTDATYVVENGGYAYIRDISSPNAVLYVALEKKNRESLESIPFFLRYHGILIHDHEVVMYHFGDKHAECNEHCNRYLRRNTEETQNSWSIELETLLYQMNEFKKDNGGVVPERIRYALTAQYHALIEKGYEQNKTTKYKYAAKAERALLNRLNNYADEHLLFMENEHVPFTNNQSERDLRKAKRRSKACGGFRAHSGNEMYCSLLSIAETAKRKEVSLYGTLKDLASGKKSFLFQNA